ncbi:MAG: flagellar assembly protein FliW [Bythopirellula sp.]|nr:flagellar assembly protein FliW [Bythopirellula sp.]
MDVFTTRFGVLSVQPHDEIVFEQGLIGLEDCKRWVVLTDSNNPALGWLQNLDQGHIALGVVSPRRFVPEYQLRVDRADLRTLGLVTIRDAEVVVIASRQPSPAVDSRLRGNDGKDSTGLTLNLRAPLVINVEKRLGCQVIAKDEHPVQYPLDLQNLKLRRIA